MLFTANGFYKVYEQLKLNELERIGKSFNEQLLSVTATNGYFALEIYLKFMYSVIYWEDNEKCKQCPENNTEFPMGHDLKMLFEKLDNRFKKPILRELSRDFTEKEVLVELENCKNAFVDWRYIFEKQYMEGNFDFLSKILHSIHLICNLVAEYSSFSREEWETKDSSIDVIMSEKKFASIEEAKKYLNMS